MQRIYFALTSCLLTNQWTNAERWVCVRIEVKALQDAVNFAMSASEQHKGVGALYTHPPSHQPQCPGQSLMAQCGNFDTVTTQCHEDGRKQWERNSNQPHLNSRRKYCNKISVDKRGGS